MRQSPFIYGSVVSSSSFTNREKEVEKLFNNLTQGVNTTIISPRRWGKSSLVEKVVNNIIKDLPEFRTVIIDLFSVSSEEEFLELFAREIIKASSSKWEDWVNTGREIFKNLIPKMSIGIDPTTDFSLSFDWSEVIKHRDEILNLPEQLSEKKGFKFIICLDEFQDLATFKNYEAFEKSLRSNWQRHKGVTYCLYGSKRHMMSDIFNNPTKPFYRFGDILLLQKIETDKWVEFIMEGFLNTGVEISKDIAVKIPVLMKNHSWYVQQFAHYTWQKCDKTATEIELKMALSELINANTPLYQKELETISSTQINLLKAVAGGETKLTSKAVMDKYRLGTPRNVSKNIKSMIVNDIIDKTNGGYEFLDPAFELWFLNHYFDKDYLDFGDLL